MAEDKKIRVSADLSEMRRLRDEIVSLYRDINNSEEKSRQATEQSLNQLRQQLSLMTDRVSLEKMLADLRQQQSGAVYNQGENSITWDIQPEEGGSRKAPTPRRGTQAAAMSDLANIMRDVEKSVVSIRDYLTSERPAEDKNSSEDIFIDIKNNIRDLRQDLSSLSRERVRDISNDEDKNSNKQIFQQPNNNNDNIDKILGSISTLREKLNSSLEGINASNREIVNETKLINRYLDVIGASVSIIEDNSTSSGGGVGGGVSTLGSVKGGIVGGLVATLSQELLKYGRQFVDLFGTRYLRNQRAEAQAMYTDPISNVGLALRTRGANEADYFRWIPIVGKYIAQSIETKYETQGEMAMTGLQALRQTQNQLVSLAQTMGLSISGATGIASREGSYAARALGMNIGEYGERRAQLLRASGGRIRSASEAQSLMAAERLFGISPSTINALQGSMRFNTNERTTGSEVISIFERTMRELRLPFEEIASTIEESLTTFNQTSERILSRTGEVDAVRLTSALAGIRSFTGARGRQLERYQQAFTGQNISNDENTRALLMRSFFELNPGAQLSDFKVMQDNWTQGRGLDTLFYSLNRLQELTGGNKQATFTALEQMFPGLSATDIEGLFKGGSTIDFKELQTTIEKNVKEASENELTYSKNIAKSITGIEGEFKSYDNRMLTIGGQSVTLLQRILAEVAMMNMKMDPGEQYWNRMREKTEGINIFTKSDQGTPWRNQYQKMLVEINRLQQRGEIDENEAKKLKDQALISAKFMKSQSDVSENRSSFERIGLMSADATIGGMFHRDKVRQEVEDPNTLIKTMLPYSKSFDDLKKAIEENTSEQRKMRSDWKTMTIEVPN
jgi:predicted translin family RNA/ssDNA-binding protein